jgi:hypothetical protein
MKNIQGLVIALALGTAGALLNWAYLHSASQGEEPINYVGVKPGVTIARGERLVEENFVPVPIPKSAVGNLDDFAIRWADRSSAIANRNAARMLTGRSLLLEDDVRTSPAELKLKKPNTPEDEEERAEFVPVDTQSFVASLINPGDRVSFRVRLKSPNTPTLAGDGGRPGPPVEIIGPFDVLSLGNRLSSTEVMKASKISQTQENVMTIRVKYRDGQPEPKAQKLFSLLNATNSRGVGVILHPREN